MKLQGSFWSFSRGLSPAFTTPEALTAIVLTLIILGLSKDSIHLWLLSCSDGGLNYCRCGGGVRQTGCLFTFRFL